MSEENDVASMGDHVPTIPMDEYEIVLPKNEQGCTFHFYRNRQGRPAFKKWDKKNRSKSVISQQQQQKQRGVKNKGDEFLEVDGVSIRELSYEDARNILKRCFRDKTAVHLRLRDCSYPTSSTTAQNKTLSRLSDELDVIQMDLQKSYDERDETRRREDELLASLRQDENRWKDHTAEPITSLLTLPKSSHSVVDDESDCCSTTEDTSLPDDVEGSESSPMLDKALALTKSVSSLMTQEKTLMDTMTEMSEMIDKETSDWVATPERGSSENSMSLEELESKDSTRREEKLQKQVYALQQNLIQIQDQLTRQEQELAELAQKLHGTCSNDANQEDSTVLQEGDTDAIIRNLLLMATVGGCLLKQSIIK